MYTRLEEESNKKNDMSLISFFIYTFFFFHYR